MLEQQLSQRQLADAVIVEPRYARAADVNRDCSDRTNLPPFRFTSKSVELLRSLIEGLTAPGGGGQATAVVGPYGSGKSLFAVALVSLLDDGRDDAWAVETSKALRAIDPTLADCIADSRRRGGYLCIAVEATADGIARPLLAALKDEIPRVGRQPALLRRVRALLRHDRDDDLTGVVEDVLRAAHDAGFLGIYIVIDEFGRVLEADPQASSRSLAAIQELAELAERTTNPQLNLLVTVHQNFQDYTTTLSPGRKAEWAKVQGRFRQVPYLADASDVYKALAASLTHSPAISQEVGRWAAEAWARTEPVLGPSGDDWLKEEASALWPLHPLAAFVLPRLATAVGQNERSMYGFVSSGDPKGLRAWLSRRSYFGRSLPSIGVDWLFDYFAASEFGAGLPRRTRQVLAQSRVALEQLADAGGTQTRVLKVMAAISLIRDQCGLRPTYGVIAAALHDVSGREVDQAVKALVERRVLLRRDRSGEYVLNAGAGVDVDDLIERTIQDVAGSMSLRREVEHMVHLEPVVAQRLSFESGTTRSFTREFVSADNLGADGPSERVGWRSTRENLDGSISYVLAVDGGQVDFASRVASRHSSPWDILVVPSEPLTGLPDLAIELAALRRLQSESGLDSVARQELNDRIDESESLVLRALAPLLDPGEAAWWHGNTFDIPKTHREVQVLLSQQAAAAFPLSPVLQNELVNRRELSSAAVVASKLIVNRLSMGEPQPGLGLQGNGPEVSITKALFERTGILRCEPATGAWFIGPPRAEDWHRVWTATEQILMQDSNSEVRVIDVWDVLASRPFGIRAGVLPLFTWAVLVANRQSLCLFESGTYLPTWSAELYDRLVRWPEAFVIRHLPADGAGGTVVSALLESWPVQSSAGHPSAEMVPLNRFLETIFGWYRQLPEYAKRTQSISDESQRLRAVLNRARDPVSLVVREIPEALGFESVGDADLSKPRLKALSKAFAASVVDLSTAYGALLNHVVSSQADLLGVPPFVDDVRTEYRRLSEALRDYSLRPATASFLLRGMDPTLADGAWCESVASSVVGTPPSGWSDVDLLAYDSKVSPFVRELLDGFETRVRLGPATDGPLADASRVAVFKSGRAVVDVVAHKSLSAAGEQVVESLRPLLESAMSGLAPSEHAALAARLLELVVPAAASERESTD